MATNVKEHERLKMKFQSVVITYTRVGYERRVKDMLSELRDLGIKIENVYFAKSSGSVYVSYSFSKEIEASLGLDKKNYVGQFVISNHSRFYSIGVKTFYTQQYEDFNKLGEGIKNTLSNVIQKTTEMEGLVCILTERELEILRIIYKSDKVGTFIETTPEQYRETLYDVYFVNGGGTPIGVTRDHMTSKILTKLRFKGCLHTAPSSNSAHISIILSAVGKVFINRYGEAVNLPAWHYYVENRTFDYWKEPDPEETDIEVPSSLCMPSDKQLDELNMTEDWFQSFDRLYTMRNSGGGITPAYRSTWAEILADKIEQWLPKGHEVLTYHIASNKNRGTFVILENQETPTLYRIVVNGGDFRHLNGALEIPLKGSSLESLQTMKKILTNSKSYKNIKTIDVTEKALKDYIMLKQLERYNIALCTTSEVVNNYKETLKEQGAPEVCLIRMLKKSAELSPYIADTRLQDLVALVNTFIELDIWIVGCTNLLRDGKTLHRIHTTPSSDIIFTVAQQFMPYIVDDIIKENEARIPIVRDLLRGDIDFIKPSEVYVY